MTENLYLQTDFKMKKKKTYAQRAKAILKKFEGRNSPADRRTLKALMEELRMEQEAEKQAQMEAQGGPSLDEMDVMPTNEAAAGALFPLIGKMFAKKAAAGAAAGAIGGPAGAAQAGLAAENAGQTTGLGGDGSLDPDNILAAGKTIFDTFSTEADEGIDSSGRVRVNPEDVQKSNVVNSATDLTNVAKSFSKGDVLGVGANLVKFGAGIFGGNKKRKKAAERSLRNNDWASANAYTSMPYKYGGKMTNSYEDKGLAKFFKKQEGQDKSGAGQALDIIKDVASFAPAIGALTNKIERTNTPRGRELSGNITLPKLDERTLMREIRGNTNEAGAAREGSGGNLAAYNSLFRANKAQEDRMVGQGATKMQMTNADIGAKEIAMNQQRDMFNSQLYEKFIDRQAMDEGAYQTARNQNRADIFTNIGNIAKEYQDRETVENMFGYRYDGTYLKDKNGNILKDKDGKPYKFYNEKEVEAFKKKILAKLNSEKK